MTTAGLPPAPTPPPAGPTNDLWSHIFCALAVLCFITAMALPVTTGIPNVNYKLPVYVLFAFPFAIGLICLIVAGKLRSDQLRDITKAAIDLIPVKIVAKDKNDA